MIKLIQGHDATLHCDLIDQMFRLRASAFHDRLGWDVNVVDGRERDHFDDCDPLYLLALDGVRRVVGSARLLQTTGPNMLSNVFSELLPQGLSIRSPIVWESTRFCVGGDIETARSSYGISRISGEIMAAEIEVGLLAGLSHIVTVVDVRMERILRRGGCPVERLGEPKRIGRTLTLAVLIDVSQEVLSSIRAAHDIDGSCLDSSEMPLSMAA